MRGRYQGVGNIVRFNWPLYVGALFVGFIAVWVASSFEGTPRLLAVAFLALASLQIFVSLSVSHFVYDRSGLYDLKCVEDWIGKCELRIVNIHAGFDETSEILREKFPGSRLATWDFYDPEKHTEQSIRRARSIFPPDPEQVKISTSRLPADDESIDLVTLIFSAHEIRNPFERDELFAEIHRTAKENGNLVVIEHLRDVPNFLAYSVGVFHFYPRGHWLQSWQRAGFEISGESKITPFVTAFLLQKQ